MFDELEDETWRKYAKPQVSQKRYLGKYLTASQFGYLAECRGVYAYVYVQSWFRRYEVTVATSVARNITMPLGHWENIPGTDWQRYVVTADA